jgi:hypothetical protein
MIWLLPHPLFTYSPVSKLCRRNKGRLRKRDNSMKGEEGRGRGRSQSYDREKAWSSINHAILSVTDHRGRMHAGFRAGTQVNYKTKLAEIGLMLLEI